MPDEVPESAPTRPSMPTEPAPAMCSFCEKPEGEADGCVPYVIAGPRGLGICNECVLLCVQILVEDPKPRPKDRGGLGAAIINTVCRFGQ